MKILVVDDSLVDRMIVRRYLLSLEHEVFLAEDSDTAITLFQSMNPDLVLLDVCMPDKDGFQLVQQMREIEPGWRPILFLSNSIDVDSFVRGIDAGADDYLHKPIEKQFLSAKLKAMERIVTMRQQLLSVSDKLAKETEKVRKIANQDGLTGIANRRYLDTVLEQEFRRHLRSQKTLSLIMVDIDFFKSFNDYFGHLAGDDILRLCANKMSELICRAGDFVARYGGEEFCIVLPNTSLVGAEKIAELLRQEIEALKISRDDLGDGQYLTISLGVASLETEHSIEELIDQADKALYQAKESGRNRVCCVEM